MKNVSQLHEPLFSDDDILEAPDRRAHGRQIAMLRLAKVQSGKREGWAFVRNLSASGMMLEVHSNFELDGIVTVTLSNDQQLQGNVRWRQDASVGIEFDRAVDIESILKKASARKAGQASRMPRVQMKHPVILKFGPRTLQADICDISPTGVCVRTDQLFEPGKRLKLIVPPMLDIEGTVRWQVQERVGIAFQERLSIHNLMSWLSSYYQASVDDLGESSSHDEEHQVSDTVIGAMSTRQSYHIYGHDDLGRAMPIATLDSADAAIRYSKATSRYFERVSVTIPGGAELPMARLVQLAIAEQQDDDD